MILGKNVDLTPLQRSSIPLYLKWFNDQEILKYILLYRPLTIEEEEEWYEHAVKNPNQVYFEIHFHQLDKKTRIIGNCSIIVDWKNRNGSLGIVIGEKDCWGKGYGTEAMQLLIEYGFSTLGLHRLYLDVYANNPRAIKCYQKLGLIEEGRNRHQMYLEGEFVDVISMGILENEWKTIKSLK